MSIKLKEPNKKQEEEEENTISKQLKKLWNKREISIVNNIILELEDNRKCRKENILKDQDSLIKTLETILVRKEENVNDILLEIPHY